MEINLNRYLDPTLKTGAARRLRKQILYRKQAIFSRVRRSKN